MAQRPKLIGFAVLGYALVCLLNQAFRAWTPTVLAHQPALVQTLQTSDASMAEWQETVRRLEQKRELARLPTQKSK